MVCIFWSFELLSAGMNSLLRERRWLKLFQHLSHMIQRQKSLKITFYIPQMGKRMMVIILWLMFFVGLVARSPFLKKLCVPLGSHCLLSMWRYFISLVSFDIIACLELKRMEVHLWNFEALLSCQKLCIDECLASASTLHSPIAHLSIGHVGPT